MKCMLQWDSVRHAQKIHSLLMIYFLVLEFQVKSSSVEYLMPYTGMSVIFILISTDNLLRKYSNSYWLNFRGIHWSPQSLYPPTNLHPRRRQFFIEKVTFLTETKNRHIHRIIYPQISQKTKIYENLFPMNLKDCKITSTEYFIMTSHST